jgi:hypothetical protein
MATWLYKGAVGVPTKHDPTSLAIAETLNQSTQHRTQDVGCYAPSDPNLSKPLRLYVTIKFLALRSPSPTNLLSEHTLSGLAGVQIHHPLNFTL